MEASITGFAVFLPLRTLTTECGEKEETAKKFADAVSLKVYGDL
jgi:hypothetical protein